METCETKMVITYITLFLLGVMCTDEKTKAVVSRIVGGITAPDNNFPYQASLRNSRGSHKCGGATLNEFWILTSASCVFRIPPQKLTVVVGTNTINGGGTEYKVSKIKCHKNYRLVWNIPRNNIALVKVSNTIIFTNGVKNIPLEPTSVGAGIDSIISGWGKTTYAGYSTELRYIIVKTITNADCQQRLKRDKVLNNEICTFSKNGEGTCKGDGGGPVVAGGYLIGLVSWGRPCAIGFPDVHTRISEHTEWIYKIINTI